MKIYLNKINQKQLIVSSSLLDKFTVELSKDDSIYIQESNSKPVSHPFSWFGGDGFNKYINNLINDTNGNFLVIYQIKFNYYIVNAIRLQADKYNSLQLDSKWIDTDKNSLELDNKLIFNPEVLKLAFRQYFDVTSKLHDQNEYYKETTQDSYIRALEAVDSKLGFSIFSSFVKIKTDEIISNLFTLNKEKDNETFNKINNHNTLTAAIKTYQDFFDNWLGNGKLYLNNMQNKDIQNQYIIYAYQLNNSNLTSLIKIGQALFNPNLIDNSKKLQDDDYLLNYIAALEVAKKDHVSGNDAKILFSTIGIKKDGCLFDVNDVNKWLEKNNYLPENNLNNFNGWYHLTINQIKRAINAVKNQEDYCDIDTEIKLTINETNAIKSALNWWEKQNRFFEYLLTKVA